jgi:hypothetical protein
MASSVISRVNVVLLVGLTAATCGSQANPNAPGAVAQSFDFSQSAAGWTGGHAGYIQGQDASTVKTPGVMPLGDGLSGSGLYLFGNDSVSGGKGLLVYYKHQILGLLPSRSYSITFGAQIATSEPTNPPCVSVGSAPSSTVIKAGASTSEPTVVQTGSTSLGTAILSSSVDVGAGSANGPQGVTLGDVTTAQACGATHWALKDFSPTTLSFVTDGSGSAWVLAGVQLGFDSSAEVFLTKFSVTFTSQ